MLELRLLPDLEQLEPKALSRLIPTAPLYAQYARARSVGSARTYAARFPGATSGWSAGPKASALSSTGTSPRRRNGRIGARTCALRAYPGAYLD